MNRQQRRKAMKQGVPTVKDPVYTMKRSEVANIENEATEKATEAAMILLLSIPIKVMREKYHWGAKKRLPELAEALIDEYQSFSGGEMSLEEYQELVYQLCGIKFKKNEEE